MAKQYIQILKEASTTIQTVVNTLNRTGQRASYWGLYGDLVTKYGLSKRKYDEFLSIHIMQEAIMVTDKEIIPMNIQKETTEPAAVTPAHTPYVVNEHAEDIEDDVDDSPVVEGLGRHLKMGEDPDD